MEARSIFKMSNIYTGGLYVYDSLYTETNKLDVRIGLIAILKIYFLLMG